MKITVACLGMGNRGKVHLNSLRANADRFEVVACCEVNPDRLKKAEEITGLPAERLYSDAEKMLSETRPDVFCFITPPNIRLELVQLAAKYKVKGLILEKPMATSVKEAREIAKICRDHEIKCVVSHQQKYLDSFEALGKTVKSGKLGKIDRIHVETLAWYSQLGTHFIDYALWAAGGARAEWAVGHVHGREKLTDVHPSPDFVYGLAGLDNGARLFFECGYLKEKKIQRDGSFWVDNRLTVQGENGYAWAETDGGYGIQVAGQPYETQQFRTWGVMENGGLQDPFAKDFADWLDGTIPEHSCNVDISLHGFELLQAMCVSALEHRRVDLPLSGNELYDTTEKMIQILPEQSTYSVKG